MEQSAAASGIRVGGTLSMALSRKRARTGGELLWLALLGAVSCFFTIETMFDPVYSLPLVLAVGAAAIGFFAWHAIHAGGRHGSLLIFVIWYGAFFLWQRKAVAAGLFYMVNDVYRAAYQTDWNFFMLDTAVEESYGTTMFLCFLMIPCAYLLMYAVLRFRNFFLSALITFPFVEVGLFFGVAPAHIPAAALFSFWCAMAAVQLADGSGSLHRGGFVRRKNRFYPVSGMKFLVTGRAGGAVFLLAFLLCMLAEAGLALFSYQRPDMIKSLRERFQNYTLDYSLPGLEELFSSSSGSGMEDTQKLEMGDIEAKPEEKLKDARVYASEQPEGMVYLRYRSFGGYADNSWNQLGDAAGDDIFSVMEEEGLSSPEFLGAVAGMCGWSSMEMSIEGEGTPRSCSPYAFLPEEHILCQGEDVLDAGAGFTVPRDQRLERAVGELPLQTKTCGELQKLAPVSGALRERLDAGREVTVPAGELTPEAARAALLEAGGYSSYVYTNYRDVPDTEAMRQIRAEYQDLLAGAPDVTVPRQVLSFLQKLRAAICDGVSYDIAPGKTPQGEDFAAYFLLENRKGYCMHYATAGVLLARMAGIPARYCEGYALDGETFEEGERDGEHLYSAEIRSTDAHAWAEIYLEGIGWVPFEFTYSFFDEAPEPAEGTSESTEPPTTEPPAEPSTELMTELLTLPSEAPEGTEVPGVLATQTPSGGENGTMDTTFASEGDIYYTPGGRPVGGGSATPGKLKAVVTILLVVAAILLTIAGFVLARRYALKKRHDALYQSDAEAAARAAWTYLLSLLRSCGVSLDTATAAGLQAQAEERCGDYLSPELLRDALSAGTRIRYSAHPPGEDAARLLREAGGALVAGMYREARPWEKFHLKWLRHYL